jgi:cell surface protein SprA
MPAAVGFLFTEVTMKNRLAILSYPIALLLLGCNETEVASIPNSYVPPGFMPIAYSGWHDISPPPSTVPDTIRMYSKARLIWYNRLPSDVVSQDIWPDRVTGPGENIVTVLDLSYNPRKRGVYNYSPDLQQTLHAAPANNWAGIQQLFPHHPVDVARSGLEFLEFWMKSSGSPADSNGIVYLDLGSMSEDIIPNGKLNSEDLVKTPENPNGTLNGVLNQGEDVGLDMLADSAERRVYARFVAANANDPDVDPNDPSGDDWSYVTQSQDFSMINGTENNAKGPDGRNPDTEDLNFNGILDTANNYFEYVVSLDTSGRNSQLVGGGSHGWFHYRIPLESYESRIGRPSLFGLEGIRVWFTGFDQPILLRIVEIHLAGR